MSGEEISRQPGARAEGSWGEGESERRMVRRKVPEGWNGVLQPTRECV